MQTDVGRRGEASHSRGSITSLARAAQTLALRCRNGGISGYSPRHQSARTRFAPLGAVGTAPHCVSAREQHLGVILGVRTYQRGGYKEGGGEATDSIGLRPSSSPASPPTSLRSPLPHVSLPVLSTTSVARLAQTTGPLRGKSALRVYLCLRVSEWPSSRLYWSLRRLWCAACIMCCYTG